MRIKLTYLLLFFHLFSYGQNDKFSPNYEIVSKEIIRLVNQHRDSLGLHHLKENSILNDAAQDQSNYLRWTNKLSHDQPTINKNTPADRVFFYGGNFNYIGENVAFIFSKLKDSLYKSEIQLAKALYLSWLHSPPHRENMENPNYYQIGIGLTFNPDNFRMYGAQVFSAPGYKFPKHLVTPKRAYGVQSFNESICEGVKNFRYGTLTFANSIYAKGDSVFILYHDIEYFKKIISSPNDGYALDIVFENQVPCNSPNVFHGSEIFDGYMLEPRYYYDIINSNKSKNKRKLDAFLGVVPGGLSNYELNIILIKNNHQCDYSYPVYVPYDDIPPFYIAPLIIDTSFTFTPFVIDTLINFEFDFERSSVKWNVEDQLQQFKLMFKYFNVLDSIKIQTYSSVEGKEWFNIELQEKRAEKIKSLFSNIIPDSLIMIETKENWEMFEQQIKDNELIEFYNLDHQATKNLLKTKAKDPYFDSLLFEQRTARAQVYVYEKIDALITGEGNGLILDHVYENHDLALAIHSMYEILNNNAALGNSLLLDSNMFNSYSYSCNYLADRIVTNYKNVPEFLVIPSENSSLIHSKEYTYYTANWLNLYYHDLHQTASKYYYSIDEHEPLITPEQSLVILNAVDSTLLEDPSVLSKLKLNYALSGIRYYSAKNQWSQMEHLFQVIFDYFYRADLSIEELTDLALFCNWYHKYDKTVQLLHLPFSKNELDENAAFVLAQTATLIQNELEEGVLISYMETAINFNKKRWCKWLTDNFQIRRNEKVKQMFCNTCK